MNNTCYYMSTRLKFRRTCPWDCGGCGVTKSSFSVGWLGDDLIHSFLHYVICCSGSGVYGEKGFGKVCKTKMRVRRTFVLPQ